MEKLSILDVVALAKAGYKPGEVKEIMAGMMQKSAIVSFGKKVVKKGGTHASDM